MSDSHLFKKKMKMPSYDDSKPLIITKKKPKNTVVPVDQPPLSKVKLPHPKCKLFQQTRDFQKKTLKELADEISKPVSVLKNLEKGEAVEIGIVKAVEKVLGIKLS